MFSFCDRFWNETPPNVDVWLEDTRGSALDFVQEGPNGNTLITMWLPVVSKPKESEAKATLDYK